MASDALLATIERSRKRLWGLCYRMTGSRADADDLCQEAIARAIEREGGLAHADALDGWLVRIATTVCLDHLRRRRLERRPGELVDPVDVPAVPAGPETTDPETAVILRDDVRFAVVVALQHVPPRQRAALVLHEVLDRPLGEVAAVLGVNVNAAKALVVRARAALARARGRVDVDVPVDGAVVARFVAAIQARSVDGFVALLDERVWGLTDRGGRHAGRPLAGVRAVTRAAMNRLRAWPDLAAHVRVLNGEPAVVLTAPGPDGPIVQTIHLETRAGRVVALRVVRDPEKLAVLAGRAA